MAKKPNPFAKRDKIEKAEVKKLGVKGAMREERKETPAERKREMGKGKK